ncbi:DJ-1 family glyoxalase III [Enterococcus sp. LJL99]
MYKVAVLMAEGFEESETVTIVDILRRAEIECHTFAFDELVVKGMHGILVKADKVFSEDIKEYDLLVLPGGRPGGENLRNSVDVLNLVKYFNENNKYLAAMCSGTVVLSEADVIKGKMVTGYTGYADKLVGGIFKDEVVVFDQNIITSQGPATPYPFAYRIAEVLGKNVDHLKNRMLYNFAGGK